ncbi:MAG: hypothetical protein MZV63_19635 [Marinilabiliales bacterium]|nr:hypothetical protein [Marinilabiliales bacterium]
MGAIVAGLREDIRILDERTRALTMEIEQLKRENRALREQAGAGQHADARAVQHCPGRSREGAACRRQGSRCANDAAARAPRQADAGGDRHGGEERGRTHRRITVDPVHGRLPRNRAPPTRCSPATRSTASPAASTRRSATSRTPTRSPTRARCRPGRRCSSRNADTALHSATSHGTSAQIPTRPRSRAIISGGSLLEGKDRTARCQGHARGLHRRSGEETRRLRKGRPHAGCAGLRSGGRSPTRARCPATRKSRSRTSSPTRISRAATSARAHRRAGGEHPRRGFAAADRRARGGRKVPAHRRRAPLARVPTAQAQDHPGARRAGGQRLRRVDGADREPAARRPQPDRAARLLQPVARLRPHAGAGLRAHRQGARHRRQFAATAHARRRGAGLPRTGLLSPGHAKVLLGIENRQEQLLLARRVIADGLSVRADRDTS